MLFHVYNKLDSIDCVHVYAESEVDAVSIALKDGYLTNTLGVNPEHVTAWPFSNSDQTSERVRRISKDRILQEGA